jgi:uncharacterized integral membrane protein
MKQINFAIIFILSLALAFFAIQNTESVTVQLVPGVEVKAPIAVELLLAIGLGAIMAWLFSIWTRLQVILLSTYQNRQKKAEIKELESKLQKYEAEIQSLKVALPPSKESEE